jgi:hypothetical protein
MWFLFEPASKLANLISEAAGKWLPPDLVNDGSGKVQKWASSGKGGTDYDLLTTLAAERPILSANADRAGTGPACTLIRADATKLATVSFAIVQPNTLIWIVKRTAGSALNMRLSDGRTGNTHGLYFAGGGYAATINDDVATATSGSFTVVDTWYMIGGVYGGAGAGASSIWRDGNKVAATLNGTGCDGIVLGDFGTGGGAAFDGVVERGYYWNRALSDAEMGILAAGL